MNKKLLSLLSLIIVLGMIFSVMAGCTNDPGTTPSATPSAPDGDGDGDDTPPVEGEGEHVNIRHYYDLPSHNTDATEIFDEVQKLTNTTVELMVPASDDGQNLTIMLSSGDLPEIMTIDRTNAALVKMIDGKAIYNINELMEQYAPNMLTDIEPEYFTYHKYTDGNNYYWTNYIYTPWVRSREDYPKVDAVFQVSAIRTDIYEAIGKPEVNSPETYKAMLEKAKAHDPSIATLYMPDYPVNNGGIFMNGDSPAYYFMGEWGLGRYVEKDDVITSVIRDPRFEEMCLFMNDLFVSGLYDQASLIDSSDIKSSKIDNGQVAVYHNSIGNHAFTGDVDYTNLPFFKDEAVFVKSGAGWLATTVTTQTVGEKLEGAMRYLSFQVSTEGRRLCGWGIEGRHWEWKNGVADDDDEPVKIDELWDNMDDPTDYTKKWGFWQTRALHDQYYCNSLFEKWTDERREWYELYGDVMVIDIFDGVRNPPLDDSTEGLILAKLNEEATTSMPKIITAASADAAKAELAGFIERCDALELEKLEAYWTARWQLFDPAS